MTPEQFEAMTNTINGCTLIIVAVIIAMSFVNAMSRK